MPGRSAPAVGHACIIYPEDFMRLSKIAILAMLASSIALAGCNTIEGVGRDVKSAGKAVEDAAK